MCKAVRRYKQAVQGKAGRSTPLIKYSLPNAVFT